MLTYFLQTSSLVDLLYVFFGRPTLNFQNIGLFVVRIHTPSTFIT